MSRDAADHLRTDPDLASVVDEHGPLELNPAGDPFERLVVSLTRQQVSMAAADAIEKRLFEAVEITPAGILAADEDTLREAGLSRQKTEYVRAVAETWRERAYSRETFAGASNDAVVDELTEIHGVGVWTAKMFLLFALGRPDVFPVEDLGIRRGLEAVCAGIDGETGRAAMCERARRWAPYRSYASLYLWRAYEG